MEIFGHKINLRPCGTPNTVNIYIKIGKQCLMNCDFCEFRGTDENEHPLNIFKLIYILNKIPHIKVSKISFTGGEPFLYKGHLLEALHIIKEYNPKIATVVSTSGSGFSDAYNMVNYIDSISLSRHHFDDKRNKKIFRSDAYLSTNLLKEDIIKKYADKIHLSCNLIKGQIDDPVSIYQYIKNAASLGVYDIGFVSLMPINQYCKDNVVNIKDIDFAKIPDTVETKITHNGAICECRNYLTYINPGKIVKWYIRQNTNPDACQNLLVFENNMLRIGFTGPIIHQ